MILETCPFDLKYTRNATKPSQKCWTSLVTPSFETGTCMSMMSWHCVTNRYYGIMVHLLHNKWSILLYVRACTYSTNRQMFVISTIWRCYPPTTTYNSVQSPANLKYLHIWWHFPEYVIYLVLETSGQHFISFVQDKHADTFCSCKKALLLSSNVCTLSRSLSHLRHKLKCTLSRVYSAPFFLLS